MDHAIFARLHPVRIGALGAAILTATGLSLIAATPASATLGKNDYPYRNSATSGLDKWNFDIRQCTSFVAWRLNNDKHIGFNNDYRGVYWGDASNWDNAARSAGIPVDHKPSRGSVAEFEPGVQGAGSDGHVAYVLKVSGSKVLVEEYNRKRYAYDQYWVNTAGLNYLHFPTGSSTSGNTPTVNGTVMRGDGVPAHAKPTAASRIVAKYSHGAKIGLVCKVSGDRVSGVLGTSAVWYRKSIGHYVPAVSVFVPGSIASC